MKTLTCKDMGMPECAFMAKAETDEEVMKMLGDHAASEHGMTADKMTPDMMEKMKMAIKTE